MKQHTPLQQWKSSLSIRTAFDRFDFIHKTLNHPVAPRHAASIGHRLRIVGKPIDKRDQFRDPTRPHGGFTLIQTQQSFALAEQTAKILRQRERACDGCVALDELRKIRRLLWGPILRRPYDHQRNTSGRRGVQEDRLFRDQAFSRLAKDLKLPPKGTLRTRVTLNDNLLVQQSRVMAALVPSRSQIGQVGINHRRGARPSSRRRSRFLFECLIDTARASSNELGNVLFTASLSIQLPDSFMDAHLLAMTSTTRLCDFFRHRSPRRRMCLSGAASGHFFEGTFLLPKELLQGFGKVLL